MAQFQFRFGPLKTVDIKTSAKGTEYARFAIDAGRFTAYCTAFHPDIVAAVKAIGDEVRAGGFIDANQVEKDGQKKTYQQLITRWIKVGENEPVKIPAADEAAAEAPAETAGAVETPAPAGDDLTTLKGVGALIVRKLAAHGITSFADLAATTAEQRQALAEEMKVLGRYDVFGQADAIAAEAVAA